MLGKLLKYDLKYIYRYWWIGALTTIALSFVGGFCIKIGTVEEEPAFPVVMMFFLMMFLIIFAISSFALLTSIIIFVRFYKNFFSDEGYLTFTLPIKKGTLLNSKLIAGTLAQLSSTAVIITNIFIMLAIGIGADFWSGASKGIAELWNSLGVYLLIYLAEIIAGVVLAYVFSTLFTYVCITIASIITKKARVITAIGIYYGTNTVLSYVLQIFYFFGISSFMSWSFSLSANALKPFLVLCGLALILFIAVFCGVLYVIQYRMLDRKLNLA